MDIIDIKQSRDMECLTAMVCVIGSGPAGGILAAQLAKNKIDVLLLEAGADLPDYGCESIASTSLFSDVADLRFGWSRQFGGSSNLWAGRTYPLEEIDFEKRPWIPDSGWPFKFEALSPYYEKASDILNIPGYNYFKTRGGPHRKESVFSAALDKNTDLKDRCFQWAEKPFIVSDYLKGIATQHPSLRILLNAPVSRLQEKTDGSSIESALVTKPDGSTLIIKADYFVLAAGGIETPRILLNSNQVKPAGIGNDHDIVGRYFSTHPKADMGAIVLNKSVPTSHALFMDSPLESGSFRYGIGFSKETQERLGLLNHYIQLSPLLEYQANRAFESMKRTKVLNNALIDRSRLMQGFLPGLGKMAYETMGRIAKLQPRTNKFILRGFLDQYPDKENRIKLSSNKKNDGTFKVDIQWRYSDKDKKSVLKFFSHLDAILQKNDIGKVEYSGLEKCEDWPLIGIHSHFIGTTRMGTDKKTSVTNKNARVHGTKNLYIAGPSLFPTYGFANPFLTITALSIMLGDHLLKQMR